MERTLKPVVAGVLNIVAGAFFLLGGIAVVTTLGTPTAMAITRYYMYSVGSSATITPSDITTVISVTAAVLIVPGIVSVLGGIYSLKRSLWGLALAGGVFALFYLSPLGIPAIIFTALARKEFA